MPAFVCGLLLVVGGVALAGDPPPTAAFHYSPKVPTAVASTITFTSDSTAGGAAIATLDWDFEDDTTYDTSGAAVTHSYALPGTYTVRLRVTDVDGVSTDTTRTVNVKLTNAAPDAGFGYTPSAPTPGQDVTLTSSSTDADDADSTQGTTITDWDWDIDGDQDFNDGVSGASATHAFLAGSHSVRLRVTDEHGTTDIAGPQTITVNTPPAVDFTFSPDKPKPNDPVDFNATASDTEDPAGDLTYSWNFDDGGTSTQEDPSHTFTAAGTYNVTVTVTDQLGGTGQQTHTVNVNTPPTAGFDQSPASPQTNEDVTFTDDGDSVDPDGTIESRAWDLDNDGFDDGTGTSASRPFPNDDGPNPDGSYTVRLRVTDDDGATDIKSLDVTVTNRAPNANFSQSPASPLTSENITFTDTSTDSDGTLKPTKLWDLDNDDNFGETNEVGDSVSRQFTDDGTYTIKLRVEDDDGVTAETTKSVVVLNRSPNASFSYSPSAPITGQTVTFTNTSFDEDGTVASSAWDLDNDNIYGEPAEPGQPPESAENAASPKRQFAEDRVIKLKVTDNDGAEDIETINLNIDNKPPNAAFTFSPSSPFAGQIVTFTSISSDPDGPIVSQNWDLDGDGAFDDASGVQTNLGFVAVGSYTVGLQVGDQDGATASSFQSVEVRNPPVTPPTTPAQPTGNAGPALLNPFPIVRIRGKFTRSGATRITSMSVDAPKGATVSLRCRGKGCPFKTQSRKAAAKRVRFARFKRALRPGLVLEVRVTQSAAIGKFTSFKMRKGKAPLRRDLCLQPKAKKPTTCPS